MPARVAGVQFDRRVEVAGGVFQCGEPVGCGDGEGPQIRAVEAPASVDERVNGLERVTVGASGKRAGKVAVWALPVRLGEGGGEGSDELRGRAVVEADAPGRWAEGVLVGVDAPQSVVVAFGEVAEADLAVGGREVGVADYVESGLSRPPPVAGWRGGDEGLPVFASLGPRRRPHGSLRYAPAGATRSTRVSCLQPCRTLAGHRSKLYQSQRATIRCKPTASQNRHAVSRGR